MEHYQGLSEKFFSNTVSGLRTVPLPAVAAAAEALDGIRRRGNRVYAMGNGGSASTATHLVCDLTKTAHRPPEPALRAFALSDNIALLTAYANDVSYADTFVSQLTTHAEPGDAVIAISASGRSPNIIAALRAAQRMDLLTIGMLGCGGGDAADLVDIPLIVDSDDFGVIETAHIAIVHAFADVLRAAPEKVGAMATVLKP